MRKPETHGSERNRAPCAHRTHRGIQKESAIAQLLYNRRNDRRGKKLYKQRRSAVGQHIGIRRLRQPILIENAFNAGSQPARSNRPAKRQSQRHHVHLCARLSPSHQVAEGHAGQPCADSKRNDKDEKVCQHILQFIEKRTLCSVRKQRHDGIQQAIDSHLCENRQCNDIHTAANAPCFRLIPIDTHRLLLIHVPSSYHKPDILSWFSPKLTKKSSISARPYVGYCRDAAIALYQLQTLAPDPPRMGLRSLPFRYAPSLLGVFHSRFPLSGCHTDRRYACMLK